MPQQISFAQAEDDAKRKLTRRDRFLGEMEIGCRLHRHRKARGTQGSPGELPRTQNNGAQHEVLFVLANLIIVKKALLAA